MRPNTLKAGLAAALVTFSFANAFAAETAVDTTSPRAVPAITEQEPRLGVVLGQLQSAVDGVKIERQDSAMSRTESAQLDKDAMQIRKDAEQIAAKHGGKLPASDYHQILSRIGKLGMTTGSADPSAVGAEQNDPT